jgi:CheY-like chemotaxis protein
LVQKAKEAEDGLVELKMILELRPNMVIFDVMMPKIDGLEVCLP